MRYMGSKRLLAKHMLPIMLPYRQGRPWVEPFVGGGNIIDKVEGVRIGADLNPATINALKCIRDRASELPQNDLEFTEQDYKNAMQDPEAFWFNDYALYVFAFAGTYRGGWSKDAQGSDYVKRAFNSAQAQSPLLKGVELLNLGYEDLTLLLPESALIYCDPPYQNTSGYKTGAFNHEQFFQWCRDRASEGHTVFVSEYNAPDDFIEVWHKEIKCVVSRDKSKVATKTEKLFLVSDLML